MDLIGVPSLLVPGNEPFFSGLWEWGFCNGIFLTFCIGDRFFLGIRGGESNQGGSEERVRRGLNVGSSANEIASQNFFFFFQMPSATLNGFSSLV